MSVAVVSGGASGIGLALGDTLGKRGASVILADVDEATLEPAAAQLRASGIDATGYLVDLRDTAAVEQLADHAAAKGTIETVCLNAGVAYSGPTIWETPASIWDFIFGINCFALVNQVTAFVPLLIRQGTPANVVITASIAGTIGLPTSAPYAASKAAAVSLAKSLRGELATSAPFLRVALLIPGVVQTNLQRTSSGLQPADVDVDPNFVEASHTFMNTMGAHPDEVATGVLDALASGRFWILPPSDDPFVALLNDELTELGNAISNGSPSKPSER